MLQFSDWVIWQQRDTIPNINKPGVYILAKYEPSKVPHPVDPMDEKIICVGKTTRGLKNRLNEFNGAAFSNGAPHAEGYTYKERFGSDSNGLYVSICPIYFATKPVNLPNNEIDTYMSFRVTRFVTFLEVCLRGVYVLTWGKLPELNKE